jgi:hypothetical protein
MFQFRQVLRINSEYFHWEFSPWQEGDIPEYSAEFKPTVSASCPRHYMEKSGQLDAPAALTPWKELLMGLRASMGAVAEGR